MLIFRNGLGSKIPGYCFKHVYAYLKRSSDWFIETSQTMIYEFRSGGRGGNFMFHNILDNLNSLFSYFMPLCLVSGMLNIKRKMKHNSMLERKWEILFVKRMSDLLNIKSGFFLLWLKQLKGVKIHRNVLHTFKINSYFFPTAICSGHLISTNSTSLLKLGYARPLPQYTLRPRQNISKSVGSCHEDLAYLPVKYSSAKWLDVI
jgi:hypothetical protein